MSTPVSEDTKAQDVVGDVRARHDYKLAGGSGGWEVWECARCGRNDIPSVFGFLWPAVLWRFRQWTCAAPNPSASSLVVSDGT